MATTPATYSYDYSDADESDYGDLTAEELELVDRLVTGASSSKTTAETVTSKHSRSFAPIPGPSTAASLAVSNRSRQAIATEPRSSSLRADIAAAFSSKASVKSLNTSNANFNLREALKDPSFAYHNDTSGLSRLADTATKSLPVGNAASFLADEAQPQSLYRADEADDVRYPDLSRALSKVPSNKPVNRAARDKGDESEHENKLSPLVRFRSFPKKPFSVSDLTAGAWCELQYYYTLTKLPGGRRTRTAAMVGGSKVHKTLEEEVYTTVTIEIAKKEDAFGLKVWNIIQGLRTLRDSGMTRELEVWGLVDGHVVNGIIDNLSYENPDPEFEEEIRSSQGSQEVLQGSQEVLQGKSKDQPITTFFHSSSKPTERQIYLTDVKTRGSSQLPTGAALRPTKIQLFLYHRFLCDMAAGRLDFFRVFRRYGLDPDEPFSDTFVAQIGGLHDEIFQDAFDDSNLAPSKNSGTDSDYRSALSSPKSASTTTTPDLIRYRTLRQLLPLLQRELRLTFPQGADSLGPLVTVEYRKRTSWKAEEAEEEDDQKAGSFLGSNILFVDHNVLDQYLAEDMQWWKGERDPYGVQIEEAYKCRSCEFVEECDWRREQDAQLLKRVKKKIAGRKKTG